MEHRPLVRSVDLRCVLRLQACDHDIALVGIGTQILRVRPSFHILNFKTKLSRDSSSFSGALGTITDKSCSTPLHEAISQNFLREIKLRRGQRADIFLWQIVLVQAVNSLQTAIGLKQIVKFSTRIYAGYAAR